MSLVVSASAQPTEDFVNALCHVPEVLCEMPFDAPSQFSLPQSRSYRKSVSYAEDVTMPPDQLRA
jgi:hypothetical protein